MDISPSDNKSASTKAAPGPRLRDPREAKLDERLRELYEAYGEGSMPEEIRKLAEDIDRERASLANANLSGSRKGDDEV